VKTATLFVLLAVFLEANAWGQANCGDPRATSCNPGQRVDISGNQTQCRACTGNTIGNGCSQSCSDCGHDAYPNAVHSQCVPYPAGTYQNNSKPVPFGGGCQPTGMDAGTLHATCPNYFGVKGDTSLADAEQCVTDKHDIQNIDGNLRCVLSSTPSPNGHGDVFDIVSKTESTDSAGNKTTRWRIDHPNVGQPFTQYSQIAMDEGDDYSFNAGGCVRTNGGISGQRWKQYVNPYINLQQETPAAPQSWFDAFWDGWFYRGGPCLAAKDNQNKICTQYGTQGYPPILNEPFEMILPQQLPDGVMVPRNSNANYPKQMVLALLYSDAEFSRNGYYSHDDGTNGQCKSDGPAWVDLKVVHPKNPIPYSPFAKGANFDLTWPTDKSGADDNGLPLNPLWSYQIENTGMVTDVMNSCAPNRVLNLARSTCTSQPTTEDRNTDSFLEGFGYCNTSDSILDGHVNWQIVTYTGSLDFRAWSGNPPEDDDMNFGLETDYQSGQTVDFEGPDTGIGLEFKNSDTTANYNSPFWKAIAQNATSQGQFISVNGNKPNEFANGEFGVVTGLMGIDGVHKGYSELHPVFAMAVEAVWNLPAGGGADETWAFFIRNSGNEGSCAHETHNWPSAMGDWTYSIQLPWPEGATSVQIVNTPDSAMEASAAGQEFLGMEGSKPWTYLRFKLPAYTLTGIDGEITLHYGGPVSAHSRMVHRPPRSSQAKTVTNAGAEGEFGVDWTAVSQRIADPAVRKQFMAEVTAAMQTNSANHATKMTVISMDHKETTFTRKQDFGAWIGKPVADVAQPDPENQKQSDALKAVLAKYSAALNLPQPRSTK
jgi:hypothetical protein